MVAVIAAALYVCALVVLPLFSNLDVLSSHPEDYARSNFGFIVNLSYLALAVGLVSLAVSILPVGPWSIPVVVLLLPVVLLCVALAVDPVGVARGNQLWLLPIIGLAFAPLLVTLSLRHRLRRWTTAFIVLGVAPLVAFAAVLVVPQSVGGLSNRVFDLVIGAWIIATGLAVRRTAYYGAASRPGQ